jgi:hypothetical protein
MFPRLLVLPRPLAIEVFIMKLLLGIFFGVVLTVGGAYLYDSHQAVTALNAPAAQQKPLVNWDVVAIKWEWLSERAREELKRIASSS